MQPTLRPRHQNLFEIHRSCHCLPSYFLILAGSYAPGLFHGCAHSGRGRLKIYFCIARRDLSISSDHEESLLSWYARQLWLHSHLIQGCVCSYWVCQHPSAEGNAQLQQLQQLVYGWVEPASVYLKMQPLLYFRLRSRQLCQWTLHT